MRDEALRESLPGLREAPEVTQMRRMLLGHELRAIERYEYEMQILDTLRTLVMNQAVVLGELSARVTRMEQQGEAQPEEDSSGEEDRDGDEDLDYDEVTGAFSQRTQRR